MSTGCLKLLTNALVYLILFSALLDDSFNCRRFLLGLLKHGKGDWRNISRNFVVSKTPTQVASHAQKYFIRQQLSGVKDKRRPSIHDITTVNLTDNSSSDGNKPPSLDQSNALLSQDQSAMLIDWNQSKHGSFMVFDSTHGNLLVSSPCELASNGFILQKQNLYAGFHINPHTLVFKRSQIPGHRGYP